MCSRCSNVRHCYYCGERPARALTRRGGGPDPGPVYCSYACAYAAACDSDQSQGLYWCDQCWQWHTDDAPCGSVDPLRFSLTRGCQ